MAKQRQSDRKPALSELAQTGDFIGRHIGPDAAEEKAMLKALGLGSLTELVDQAVPGTIRETERMPLGEPMGEQQALDALPPVTKERCSAFIAEAEKIKNAPSARAFVRSPEYFIPPSAIIVLPNSLARFEHRATADI